MENKNTDNTWHEILEEENSNARKKGKKKSCFVRFLLILTLLVVFFFGFLYVVQYLADLEAEARVGAMLTATAQNGSGSVVLETPTAASAAEEVPTETAEIMTATTDPDLERTATIAAQLTSVADFQATETPQD